MAKRLYRNDMSQQQRDKIAASNIGKTLSQETKRKISVSMQKYWSRLPMKPTDGDDGTATTDDLNPYKEN